MSNEKNLVLVDDHVIIRNGLKELVEKLGPYRISHEFDSGDRFLEAWPLLPVPDLVIMDICMPGKRGDQVMEVMQEKKINVPVLFLTLDDDDKVVIKLFRLGARGYLRKNCTADVLKKAITDVLQNGYFHNEFLTLSLQTNESERPESRQAIILKQFTPREREFLKWVCDIQEFTYEQIADNMGVQPRTVDGYREAIFEKFGIKSKTGLVLFVLKHKLQDFL